VFVGADLEELKPWCARRTHGVQLHFARTRSCPKNCTRDWDANYAYCEYCILTRTSCGNRYATCDYAHDPHVDAVLVDSRTAAAVGGTGVAFDWAAARLTLFHGRRFMVRRIACRAGGLNPENVAEAIATLRPWAWMWSRAWRLRRAQGS